MNRTTLSFSLTLALLSAALSGCSRREPAKAPSLPQAIELTATLVSPLNIKLTWMDPVPGAGGHIVEYATDPKGEFTPLGYLAPAQVTFTHPDLMPETNWYYRVRAYYGPASNPVDVALPDTLSDKAYASRFARPEEYSWAVPRTIPEAVKPAKWPIRRADTAAQAAPTDLKASLVPSTVSGFQLTWTGHASDAEGYLLEMKADQAPDFEVRARIDPGANAFGYAFTPPVRLGTVRVREFYFGQPSNMVHVTTGPTPSPNANAQPAAKRPSKR